MSLNSLYVKWNHKLEIGRADVHDDAPNCLSSLRATAESPSILYVIIEVFRVLQYQIDSLDIYGRLALQQYQCVSS
ncbi:hypothetical protein GJ496_005727 [Pomphorhynchus laevis]|nr:hypothetical protein GJ496_005727 [Pomphorhynchus laevis]